MPLKFELKLNFDDNSTINFSLADSSNFAIVSSSPHRTRMESSPFSKMPRELRDQIWRDALTTREGCIDVAGKTSPDEPSLLAVCKQIRTETIKIYYAENTFRIQSMAASLPPLFLKSKDLVSWLRCIGRERAAMITEIRIAAAGDGLLRHEQVFVERAVHALQGGYYDDDCTMVAEKTVAALLACGVQLRAIDMVTPGLDVKEAISWVFYKDKFDEALCRKKRQVQEV